MKRLCCAITILLCLTLVPTAALASGGLSGRIEGSTLNVTWSAPCTGECVLTVYQDGWPICVRDVSRSNGSVSVALGSVRGRYSLRLKTSQGCYTADVPASNSAPAQEPAPIATEKPSAPETPKPTEVATPEPTEVATPELTEAPVETPAPTPEDEPTEAPTQAPRPTSTPVATARPTARPTATPQPTAAPANNRSDLASQVVELVNEERAKQGLGSLRVDGELTRAACVRASEIVQSFSHTRPNGAAWSTVSSSAYGENIAMGQRTAEKVMASWMTSQGHRENILRASYGSIGVCAVVSGGVVYWVQLFGR